MIRLESSCRKRQDVQPGGAIGFRETPADKRGRWGQAGHETGESHGELPVAQLPGLQVRWQGCEVRIRLPGHRQRGQGGHVSRRCLRALRLVEAAEAAGAVRASGARLAQMCRSPQLREDWQSCSAEMGHGAEQAARPPAKCVWAAAPRRRRWLGTDVQANA